MVKVNGDLLKKITDQLHDIQYGALLITVHNDEITQLDITQKQRFEQVHHSKGTKKVAKG